MTTPPDSDAAPAADLGAVWDALDVLPRATASATLAATTVELAAVAGDRSGVAVRAAPRVAHWLGAAAVVACALGAGVVAGRATAPDPDLRILEHLPLVIHLDLLREAGSMKFLEEMARRRYPLPLRLMARQSPDVRDEEQRRFMAELGGLQAALAAELTADRLADRHRAVQALPMEERIELERSAELFARLSLAERHGLDALARAVVDPARQDLRDAALAWHQWLLSARPEDRPGIVARGTDERLEWLDWYSRRIEPRFESRGNERRGNDRPPWSPDGRPRWPRPDPAGEPRDGPGFEPPPRGPRRDERPPVRPDAGPRPGFPADAGETPAPPR